MDANSISISVQRQMRTLDEPRRTKFYSLTNELLYATTPEAYRKAHADLYLFLNSNNETQVQVNWLQWWSDRKHLMFQAFTAIDTPWSNLAEVVHAGWKNSNDNNLTILNCPYSDVKKQLSTKSTFGRDTNW